MFATTASEAFWSPCLSPLAGDDRVMLLGRWKALLPLLLALDNLLGSVTWKERFIATSAAQHPEKDLLLKWSSARHLRGLRWEAISNFCSEVPCLTED